MSKNKTKFRLPTKEEFENLIDHFSRWNQEKKGIEILNEDRDILFIPAAGYYRYTSSKEVGYSGNYWSSTVCKTDSDFAYSLCFYSSNKKMYTDFSNYKYAIRLVSDEPFEGGILFDGIWWKPENEEGYYTFNDAIENFNK